MHEGDEDLARMVRFYEDAKKVDPSFTLEVGESCRMRNDHVDKLPEGARFKLLYTRTAQDTYRWLDSEGNQGHDFNALGPLMFYEKHWEKL